MTVASVGCCSNSIVQLFRKINIVGSREKDRGSWGETPRPERTLNERKMLILFGEVITGSSEAFLFLNKSLACLHFSAYTIKQQINQSIFTLEEVEDS